MGGARPGHRPLRPGLEDVHGLPDRPRGQRAAGDGDAGGLARHLLGGHGEKGAVPVRPGHAHVPRLRRSRPSGGRRARRRRLVLRRLPRAAGRHAVGGRLRRGPRPHRSRQRANEALPARSAARRLAERRPGGPAGRRRRQARLRRHRERRPRRPRHPLGAIHALPSRPGRPAQPGQRVDLGPLPRRAGPRLGRGQRLRRELALTVGAAVRGDPRRSRRPRRPARDLDRRGRGRPDLGGHGRRRAARRRPADGTRQPLSASPRRSRLGVERRAERAGRPRRPDLGRLLERRALPHRHPRRPRPLLPPAGRPALADERQHLARPRRRRGRAAGRDERRRVPLRRAPRELRAAERPLPGSRAGLGLGGGPRRRRRPLARAPDEHRARGPAQRRGAALRGRHPEEAPSWDRSWTRSTSTLAATSGWGRSAG